MRLPLAMAAEPEKSGIPIIGIAASWAISHGASEKMAP